MENVSSKYQYLAELERKKWKERIIMVLIYLFLGIGELVASILLIIRSHQFYVGGVYLGCFAILVSILGYNITIEGYWLLISLIMTAASIISSILQGIAWSDIFSLKACAIYTSNFHPSCTQFPNYYDCFGDSSKFIEAERCAFDYKAGNSDSCNCVSKGFTTSCLVFEGINDCDALVNTIPPIFLTSFVFAILLSYFSAMISWRMDHLYRKRKEYRPPKPPVHQTVEFVLDTPLSAKIFSKPSIT